jgi:hypothetical protein
VAEVTEDGQVVVTWYMRHGATFVKNYQWKTGTPALPVNLTGWTARVHIREKLADAAILLALTTENGAITLDASGNIAVTVSAAQTKAFTPLKKAVFDLELQSPTGFVRNLVGGTIEIGLNVTREV